MFVQKTEMPSCSLCGKHSLDVTDPFVVAENKLPDLPEMDYDMESCFLAARKRAGRSPLLEKRLSV